MTLATLQRLALPCALALLGACSKSEAPGRTGASAQEASGTTAVAASVCNRHLLEIEDVAGILSTPIIGTQSLPGDAQSCEFATASFPAIIISVRPGLGRTTLDAWATGKMPLNSGPLPGVGEGAVWLDDLHEVIAQKNALLCDIRVLGGGSDLALNVNALPDVLGALCNRIFTAY
jgi:hypothetical protein